MHRHIRFRAFLSLRSGFRSDGFMSRFDLYSRERYGPCSTLRHELIRPLISDQIILFRTWVHKNIPRPHP
nr:hypothetical protein Q903MT_gene5003 [Picea sitchensis]